MKKGSLMRETIARMKQLEYALLRGLGIGGNHDFFLVKSISRIGFLNLYRTYISLSWNLKLQHLDMYLTMDEHDGMSLEPDCNREKVY